MKSESEFQQQDPEVWI